MQTLATALCNSLNVTAADHQVVGDTTEVGSGRRLDDSDQA